MEDNVQRIFAILISIIIFFFLPMYIAFEKRDDISYALALKITNNFVENVTNKGYLSKEMYDNFIDELAATDNIYDIKLEHVSKKYFPVFYVYKDSSFKEVSKKLDYSLATSSYTYDVEGKKLDPKIGGLSINNVELSYDMKLERYNEKQILEVLNTDTKPFIRLNSSDYKNYSYENIPYNPIVYGRLIDGTTDKYENYYAMSAGDEFSVIIQNTNGTIATSMFNTFTFAGDAGVRSRVYINYGGTVKEEQYKELDFSTNK